MGFSLPKILNFSPNPPTSIRPFKNYTKFPYFTPYKKHQNLGTAYQMDNKLKTMEEITFEIESNEEIWELVDKEVTTIFIPKFNPNQAIEWWKTDLKIKDGRLLKNLSVRQMQLDIETDLPGLKQFIEMNTPSLSIYQFEKKIADTFDLDRLPEKNKEQILKQNGLRHIFWVNFEFLTVRSFDSGFIHSIKKNPRFEKRIGGDKTVFDPKKT